MKRIFYSLILLIGLFISGQAQTFEIAHKSHSGSAETTRYSGTERFGEVYIPPISTIERIQNDSISVTIVYYGKPNQPRAESYRVYNHPIFNNPNIDIDSLKASYPVNVIWIGFDTEILPVMESTDKVKKKGGIIPFFELGGPDGKMIFSVLLILGTALYVSRSSGRVTSV